MKKLLFICLAVIFVAPQLASAAWWNPFSWFQSWKQEDQKTQVLENRIKELESRLGSSTANTTAQPEKAPAISKKEESIPTQKTPTAEPAIIKTTSANLYDEKVFVNEIGKNYNLLNNGNYQQYTKDVQKLISQKQLPSAKEYIPSALEALSIVRDNIKNLQNTYTNLNIDDYVVLSKLKDAADNDYLALQITLSALNDNSRNLQISDYEDIQINSHYITSDADMREIYDYIVLHH